MSANLDAMKADTARILSDWGESLTIKRATVAYGDDGQSTETWNTQGGAVTGEWQPVTGSTERHEAGRQVKTDAQFICLVGQNIMEGDRVYRADESYETVAYIKKYEDHWTVFLTKTEGEQ